VNVAMVSLPSITIAAMAAHRYGLTNDLAWPISWREWTSAFIYGALGATTIAAVINSAYLLGAGALLIETVGNSHPGDFESGVRDLPDGWGIFFDLSLLSGVAPLNEETWKGLIVAMFFFRHGGVGRCFLWGVLAGSGFNLLETFSNSLAVISPDSLADETIGGQWWFFALARTGTAAMHALATGLAAVGFYGLFRRRWRYVPMFAGAVALHAAWNFTVYAIWGEGFFSGAGPDSALLDALGGAGLIALFVLSAALLWVLPGRIRDAGPAHIYRVLGMAPTTVDARFVDAGAWAEAVRGPGVSAAQYVR
jgi:hypothetical protein